MLRGEQKAKRWKVEFSARALAVGVTLICCYFGCWHLTITYGIPEGKYIARSGEFGDNFDPDKHGSVVIRSYSPLPFVISCDEYDVEPGFGETLYLRRYYLWMFGLRSKCPYEFRIATP